MPAEHTVLVFGLSAQSGGSRLWAERLGGYRPRGRVSRRQSEATAHRPIYPPLPWSIRSAGSDGHEGHGAMTTLASEHLSDHGLLALVARGDHEAFARLYDGYGAAAHALATRIVRDCDLAADVVQDAFLTIWNQASRFDAARGEPSTWILSLTHHKAVDVVRRESRRRVEAIDDTHDAVDSAAAV